MRNQEVFCQPPVAAKPDECSLDDRAPRKQAKASGLIGSLDDGKRPLPHPGEGRCQLFASVTAIGEDVAQPGEEIADRRQHADRAVAMLDVGAVHLGADQEPVGVGDDVALAPVDLLAGVVPARPAALGSFDRLAVDDPAREARFSARPFAGLLEQDEIDPFPQPIGLPRIEVALHRRAVGKIVRQQAPRAGRSRDVKQALDNFPADPLCEAAPAALRPA